MKLHALQIPKTILPLFAVSGLPLITHAFRIIGISDAI